MKIVILKTFNEYINNVDGTAIKKSYKRGEILNLNLELSTELILAGLASLEITKPVSQIIVPSSKALKTALDSVKASLIFKVNKNDTTALQREHAAVFDVYSLKKHFNITSKMLWQAWVQ